MENGMQDRFENLFLKSATLPLLEKSSIRSMKGATREIKAPNEFRQGNSNDFQPSNEQVN